ncbi:YdcF family protein [Streptomyces sp. ME02-8801-2C]|uniref:YdcF family protein n=1 Tax=Streptomyces sp. ME02-8801-2C TaxID=3028680 RepID=UPI0029B43152|nr:YdcF family protein [Streptomyces sp. ME02-8801-2C]MDX3451302.1 YdcF family protein [Streptomyces sp. ME02-8801-2C]
MITFAPAGVFFLVFVCSFLYDRRLVRNGVYLFLALLFLASGLLLKLATVSQTATLILLWTLWFLLIVLPLVLGVFLIVNGVTMLRREGRRPANLLSLAAGAGILLFIALKVMADQTRWDALDTPVDAVGFVLGYVSLLFVCFVLYSFVYGRIRHRHSVDFIVVLGSGLIEGSRVPPLLAGRLDRGRAAFDAERAKGREAMLLTSGGQGPDEDLPEARAMADYLIAGGVPADRILVEDKSRTTQENLRFSKTLMQARKTDYRALVVTNNFHVMRAAQIARKEKLAAQVIGSPTARYFWPNATIREFAAVFLSHRFLNLSICVLLAVIGLLRLH